MGYVTGELRITARLSDHHDERDFEHRELWAQFIAGVRTLVAQPEFDDIEIDLSDNSPS